MDWLGKNDRGEVFTNRKRSLKQHKILTKLPT